MVWNGKPNPRIGHHPIAIAILMVVVIIAVGC
jgi:hypothetical protein